MRLIRRHHAAASAPFRSATDRSSAMSAFRLFAITLLALAPLAASPAGAASIMIAGTFDGTFADRSFAGKAVTFHGTTVADAPDEVFDERQYALSSLVVTLDGTDLVVTEPTMFFIAPLSRLAGIVDPDASRGLIRFDYSRNNIVLVDALTQSFATGSGLLRLGAGTGVRVSGIELSSTASAVPEPASWAMILIGIAGAGTALRRQGRRRLPATV
jgi:hypothetical protein